MKLSLSAALMFALFRTGAVFAQTPAATPPPLPPGPLLERAPDFSCWRITRIDTSAPAAPQGKSASKTPPKAQKLITVITKTGAITRVESVDQDGQQISRWCYGGEVFVQLPGWPAPERIGGPDHEGYYVSFAKSDFPECAWVSVKSYTGIKEVLGHQCIIFGDKVDNLDDITRQDMERSGQKADASSFLADGAACIDLESRLPVVARKGNYSYIYDILAAPTEMQTLPPAITQMIKAELQRQSDLTRHPAQS